MSAVRRGFCKSSKSSKSNDTRAISLDDTIDNVLNHVALHTNLHENSANAEFDWTKCQGLSRHFSHKIFQSSVITKRLMTTECNETIDADGKIHCTRCDIHGELSNAVFIFPTYLTTIVSGDTVNVRVTGITHLMRLVHLAKWHPGLLPIIGNYFRTHESTIMTEKCNFGNIVNFVCKFWASVHPHVISFLRGLRIDRMHIHAELEYIYMGRFLHQTDSLLELDCPPDRIMTDYEKLLDVDKFPGDMIFILADGTHMKAISYLIVARSPYFERLLGHSGNATLSGVEIHVNNEGEFPQISERAMREFLRYIYTGRIARGIFNNAPDYIEFLAQLMYLGEKYMLSDLEMRSASGWLYENINPYNVLQILDTFSRLNTTSCAAIIDKCIPLIERNIITVKDVNVESNLPTNVTLSVTSVNARSLFAHLIMARERKYMSLYDKCLGILVRYPETLKEPYHLLNPVPELTQLADYEQWSALLIAPTIPDIACLESGQRPTVKLSAYAVDILEDICDNLLLEFSSACENLDERTSSERNSFSDSTLITKSTGDLYENLFLLSYKVYTLAEGVEKERMKNMMQKLVYEYMSPDFLITVVKRADIIEYPAYIVALEQSCMRQSALTRKNIPQPNMHLKLAQAQPVNNSNNTNRRWFKDSP